MNPTPNKIESLLARIFLALAGFVICFAAIELFARFYLWHIASEEDFRAFASITQLKDRYGDDLFVQEVDKRKLSWSPHLHLGHFPTPNFRHGENMHNEYGFRGERFTRVKSPNAFRIVALGGSTTYSIDVQDYRGSYPSLLQAHLHDAGFETVEALNAGAVGYASHQNLINLQLRVLPLQPDLVIVYQGFNDIAQRFVHPPSLYLGDGSGAARPFVRGVFMPDIAEYSTALRLLGILAGATRSHAALDWHVQGFPKSYHGRQFEYQYKSGRYPEGIFQEVSAAEMLANNPPVHFERNLAYMISAAAESQVEVLLVTMVLDSDFHETSGEARNAHYTSDEYVFAMAQHNESTRRIASATGAALFDLAEEFPDDASLFNDGLHMNADGNRKRAQLIGDFVIRHFSAEIRAAASS